MRSGTGGVGCGGAEGEAWVGDGRKGGWGGHWWMECGERA